LSKKNRAKLAIRLTLALVFVILYKMDRRMARLQREFAGLRGQLLSVRPFHLPMNRGTIAGYCQYRLPEAGSALIGANKAGNWP
jgi:hypothetical protein